MLVDVLRRYQNYNPETGHFDKVRSLREYARILGVNHSTLSLVFNGEREPGGFVIRALFDTFPAAAQTYASAIAPADAKVVVTV